MLHQGSTQHVHPPLDQPLLLASVSHNLDLPVSSIRPGCDCYFNFGESVSLVKLNQLWFRCVAVQ